MKIALFTETYLPDINGVAAHVDTLKIGLESLGHKVLVVAADKYARKHYLLNGVLHCPSVESKKFYGFGIASPFSASRFRFVQDFNPDLIHVHHEFGVGLSGINAARRLNVPLVYTLHTMYDMYIHYIAPTPFQKIATNFSHQYEKYVSTHATILASPSRKGEAYFRKIGIDKEFRIIPNSADFDMFNYNVINSKEKQELKKQLNIPQNRTTACFVGRLGQEKSVDVLLDCWAESLTPADNLHLLIMGDGPDRELLIEQAKKLGIQDMVTFTGRIEHYEIPKYFAMCDAYITASLSEMNSISMLEGMASGLPTLQRFDELNADQIQVGINGNLFHNHEDMAKYLREIAALSQKEKQELKIRVRDSISDRDTVGLAKYVMNIYKEAVRIKFPENAPVRLSAKVKVGVPRNNIKK